LEHLLRGLEQCHRNPTVITLYELSVDPGVSFLIVRGRHERADASHSLLCAGAERPASG
jgi:hypothetical protein